MKSKRLFLTMLLMTSLAANAQIFSSQGTDAVSQGKRVYIPVTDTFVEHIEGSRHLADLIQKEGFWSVVDNAAEADLVLKYHFSDKLLDHARLELCDPSGTELAHSYYFRVRGSSEAEAGRRSAQKLYTKCIEKGLYRSKLRNWDLPSFSAQISFAGAGAMTGHKIGVIMDGAILEPSITLNYNPNRFISVGIGGTYLMQRNHSQIENTAFFPHIDARWNILVPLWSKNPLLYLEAGVGYAINGKTSVAFDTNQWGRRDEFDYKLKAAFLLNVGKRIGAFDISALCQIIQVSRTTIIHFSDYSTESEKENMDVFIGARLGYALDFGRRIKGTR